MLYEAIPVWSGLSKYIIYKSNVEGAAGTRGADETITELEDDKVYIIGGIVDRNRYKNLTLNKAKQLGYRCAKCVLRGGVITRLPLELVRFHGSRVLTVNNGGRGAGV